MKRLSAILEGLAPNVTPVVAMHHPPFNLKGHRFKQYLDGLQGFSPILELLQGKNAVILHGHIHILSDRIVGDTRIIGVPSASNDTQTEQKQLAYNKLRITNKGLERVTCTRYWPHNDTFETIELKEKRTPL